jgi:hypothetical protein
MESIAESRTCSHGQAEVDRSITEQKSDAEATRDQIRSLVTKSREG